MDPRDAFDITKAESFDPETIGITGDMAKEFRRTIRGKVAGPRERHQFYETAAQEIGWCFSKPGPMDERSQPSGSDAPQMGLGWLQPGARMPSKTMLEKPADQKPQGPTHRSVVEDAGCSPQRATSGRAAAFDQRRPGNGAAACDRSERRRPQSAPASHESHPRDSRQRSHV